MDDPIVRRVFPMLSRCPFCRSDRWRSCGHSRSSGPDDGNMRYRRCLQCSATYKVVAIAFEVDRGRLSSEIIPPPP